MLGFVAIKFQWTNTSGMTDSLNRYLNPVSTTTAPTWVESEEYKSFEVSIVKDSVVINKAAKDSGVDARLIVGALLAEQMRLYADSREVFKQFFEPLKILGVQSQFSWGVMGVKRETAIEIENHLKDNTSVYYLGPEYEHLLDFNTNDIEQERFQRIINEDDQYYSYLYAGLYMKQIMKQWRDAGFPVEEKPEVIATLYNIGFVHSKPHANGKPGGAEIIIAGKTYSFGGLAYEFYNSKELITYFPKR